MNFQLISRCLELANDSVIITKGYPLKEGGPEIVYVNRAFTRLTGYTEKEVLGKTPRIFQGEQTDKKVTGEIPKALGNKENITVEIINYHKNGTPYWIELSISPVVDEDGETEYFISVQKDITTRKIEEEKLKSTLADLEGKIAMLNQINLATAHDLKEPIRTIHSFLQLLERNMASKLEAADKEYFTYIKNGAKRLESTINSLYQYSMIGNDDSTTEVELANAISDARQNLLKKIETKRATITITGNGEIIGNKSELIRLFQNLIDNSLKHIQQNNLPTIKIDITTEANEITVLFSDNGKGIPQKHRQEIFNLFSSFNTREKEESLGAGLAICKKIVENHKGTIMVLNSSEQGTTFMIRFNGLKLVNLNGAEESTVKTKIINKLSYELIRKTAKRKIY